MDINGDDMAPQIFEETRKYFHMGGQELGWDISNYSTPTPLYCTDILYHTEFHQTHRYSRVVPNRRCDGLLFVTRTYVVT